jgi:hypothetical protein
MDDEQFWRMIEEAWQAAGGCEDVRAALASGQLTWDRGQDHWERLWPALEQSASALRRQLEQLPAADLLSFDRMLERKLYDLDRQEIHAATDGSDDGFLYARGFIVAMGRNYYEAIRDDPGKALPDLWCEEICYLPALLYLDKYGEMPKSDITRESGANPDGWPDLK